MSIKANPRDFLFTKVKQSAPERNGFDLSHENKQTCKAGYLYPFELLEALPGDDFEIQTETFIRLQAMLSPTMHRLKSYWHWFFVPNRLTWNYWEEFISRGNGKKLPAGQEYTPPEPVTMSLYDMIYAFSSITSGEIVRRINKYFDSDDTETIDSRFWNFDGIDGKVNFLQQVFPEFVVRLGLERSSSWCINFFSATPRIATSMGIVDTSVLVGVIDVNQSGQTYSIKYFNYNGINRSSDGVRGDLSLSQEYWVARLQNIKLSVMPLVAYALIYNDYYRDENLIEELDEMLNFFREETGALDLTDTLTLSYTKQLLRCYYRAWEKDYFTTATQMPQKAPDVLIPNIPTGVSSDGDLMFSRGSNQATIPGYTHNLVMAGTQGSYSGPFMNNLDVNNSQSHSTVKYYSGLTLNNSGQSTTVADIRRSFALQRWFEKAVRTGTRYIETLKAFFNSDAGDARLQRPEYIGGTAAPIQISDVVQTSATADGSDTPQGNLAGYGVVSDNSEVMRYHAPEHGFLLGIFSILARTSYGQGVPKVFSRETWLDYAFPEFEHIGEQGVQNKELAAAPLTKDIVNDDWTTQDLNAPFWWNTNTPNQFFGYQSRYSDYKQIQDRFGGAFSRSLDFWSLGRIFANEPTLSKEFVEAKVSDRNFALTLQEDENLVRVDSEYLAQDVDTDQYICDFWVDVKKVTSLTLFSEPI